MAYRGHQETPRALGTSLSSPLRCPGWAASAGESHCHLVGKARIASTLPRAQRAANLLPATSQALLENRTWRNLRVLWCGGRKEVQGAHIYQC